jgi:hypothetical protein
MIFNTSGRLRAPHYILQHSSTTVILLPGMTEYIGREVTLYICIGKYSVRILAEIPIPAILTVIIFLSPSMQNFGMVPRVISTSSFQIPSNPSFIFLSYDAVHSRY